MLPSHHWAHDFAVQPRDVDYLINWLLEKETPLTTRELATILVEKRRAEEIAALRARFQDAHLYNPAATFQVGQQVVFPVFDYASAVVTDLRSGQNEAYGDFSVIGVKFEDDKRERYFAANFQAPHKLSEAGGNIDDLVQNLADLTADAIMAAIGDDTVAALEMHLHDNEALINVAGQWFPRDLILELNDGHLNLAEAVLDLTGGGPLPTDFILEQIGGIGDYPMSLQMFSMNYTLNRHDGFAEVGPAGEILWYLTRMLPAEVRETPPLLRYSPLEYDRSLLTDEMLTLESEICDEHSPLAFVETAKESTVTLIYPHRRSGTLPLNPRVRYIFPFAKTSHIWITLVDAQDGEEYTGWVIPGASYVYGLGPLYAKYRVPIGAYVTVSKSQEPDKVNVRFNTYKARTEWVRLMEPKGEQLRFEEKQRSIGVDYDDLMILGIDDLEAVDKFVATAQKQNKSLTALLHMLIPALGRMTPQGTVHLTTIYSAVNVVRRCPPGPVMATLEANPDFENVGGHYWRLSG